MFANNDAILMAGQYFLVRRYLQRNQKPKAIILVWYNPLHPILNSPYYVENYFQRCFLKPGEIMEIMSRKDVKSWFVTIMIILNVHLR